MAKIIIIGASISGHTAALKLRERDKDSDITLITEGGYPCYDRRRLPDFLSGAIKEEDLFLAGEDCYKENNINFIKGRKVASVNPARKSLSFREKAEGIGYDFLIIASGRRVVPPETPGAKKDGVFCLYSLSDYRQLSKRIIIEPVCIVGSDETALAAARAVIARYKTEVKLIGANAFAGEPLPQEIEIINSQIQEIIGEGQVQAVKLKDGKAIGVSAVLFRDKFRSNTEFLKNTAIEIRDDSIAVDQNMRTGIDGIFACGAVTGIKDWQQCIQDSEALTDNFIKQTKGEKCRTY